MRNANYDKYPSTRVSGFLKEGWDSIIKHLQAEINRTGVLAVDFYSGVHEEEVLAALKQISHTLLIDTRELMRPEAELIEMTAPLMTEDVLFGHVTHLRLTDYFDIPKLNAAKERIASTSKVIIAGSGAALLAPESATLVYVDMARWEIQQRFRAHSVKALGIDNHEEAVSLQYKRGYFNDWRILDQHKDGLIQRIDFWLDTHIANQPKMTDRTTLIEGLNTTLSRPFRVVPFFDPAPWGGQWMKEVCDLPADKPNYGWCFDCVPEENSLYLNINGVRFELPSVNLVLYNPTALLGEPVEARFGKDFPIRFDFLDTVGGGNLSLQVHPTTQFIREQFGMAYTQDESYYLLDAKEGATVYLGLKEGIDPQQMINELRDAQKGKIIFDTERYVNKLPARKHDHYLIPGGTIHCSGAESLVLEISSTPNIFTFKLWDWQRLGLDGKPRPINVERGAKVINWKRDTEYVKTKLANQFTKVASGDGWVEERTGLHQNEFIETRRHWFTKTVHHHTGGGVNVLNLIEGEEAIVESPSNTFTPFVVHYAETFIIPAAVGEYTISPYGKSIGQQCGTIKANVRF